TSPRTYAWRHARGLPVNTQFFGLAIGPRTGPSEAAQVVTSSFGSGLASPTDIFFGTFRSEELVFKVAYIRAGLQRLGMCATSLTASAADPNRMYAASSNTAGALLVVLRSNDAGATWDALGASPTFLPDLVNPTKPGNTLRDDAGNQGNGWNNAI